MTTREEAHRLLDALPEDRLPDAVELLREWASAEQESRPHRRFRTTAIFDGEPDLGVRAKSIVRMSIVDMSPAVAAAHIPVALLVHDPHECDRTVRSAAISVPFVAVAGINVGQGHRHWAAVRLPHVPASRLLP